MCVHGRQRSQCKERGGVGVCEHGCMRYRCKGVSRGRGSASDAAGPRALELVVGTGTHDAGAHRGGARTQAPALPAARLPCGGQLFSAAPSPAACDGVPPPAACAAPAAAMDGGRFTEGVPAQLIGGWLLTRRRHAWLPRLAAVVAGGNNAYGSPPSAHVHVMFARALPLARCAWCRSRQRCCRPGWLAPLHATWWQVR